MRTPLLLLISLAAASAAAAPLTVRVDPAGGAPRIVINGKPARARIFFGSPGAKPIRLTPAWSRLEFDFTAATGAANGTLHLRFGEAPGRIDIDDVRVTDLDTHADLIPPCGFEEGQASFDRDWTWWPHDAANTVGRIAVMPEAAHAGAGGLRVTIQPPPDGRWPDYHVYYQPRLQVAAGHRYHVSLWVRATPERTLTLAFYRPGTQFVRLGGPPDCFPEQIKLAANVGVNFVSFPVDMPWPRPGEAPDWAAAESQCRAVLAANPKALLIPRIGMAPPAWWKQAHPDDVMQWEDGRRDEGVPASPRYRHDAAERLAALIAHLEATFGDHMAGYHPTGQNTGEWFYAETWNHPLNGYAPADAEGWHRWLQARYRADAALRAAWHDPSATRADAPVPTAAARHASPNGVFRDPATEQPLIDWARYQQQAMADCVRELAHAARTASNGRKLVLFFYGYQFEFAPVQNGPSTSGHYALRRVLDCPDIDIVCSPISYFDRGLGQSAPSMTAAESVALAGKMWLNEDDTHTYLATGTPPGVDAHVNTLAETNQELTRNVAQESLRNFATWWMDLTATGWFDDPGMWAEMKRLEAMDRWMLAHPTPFRPEVAAVIDPESMLRVAANTAVTAPGIYEARRPLGRLGAPYGQYLLDDVLAGRVHAKLYVFLNAWALTADERARLLKATRGAGRVWCYAPGWYEDEHGSLAAMRRLTGFDLAPVTPGNAVATPTAAGRARGMEHPWGAVALPRPLFAARDARPDEALATYPDGSAAAAMRRTAAGVDLFVGAPGLTSELLRVAAQAAGVRLITAVDCNVYANGPYVALHASQDGPLKVRLPWSNSVRALTLRRGETKILKKQSE